MERLRRSLPARQLRVRPLACFALAFLAGIWAADRYHPLLGPCLAGSAAAGLCAVVPSWRRRFAWLLLPLGFMLGMTRMTLAAQTLSPVETRYSVNMVGRVCSEPTVNPKTGRVIARFQLETADGAPEDLSLRLYLRGDAEAMSAIEYGQRLSLNGHIWANDPVTNPHQFDFGAWLNRAGMSAIATAKIEDVAILDQSRDLKGAFIDVRAAIAERIDTLFPRSASMARALILGDRSQLSEELRESLNATGTAHLIAISGLHVTVLAFALALFLRRFMPWRIACLVTVGPLAVYGALIGFTPAFTRALVMFAVLSLAPVAGEYSDGITRLAAAMLLWLCIHPMDIANAGFALSFTASAGILLLTSPLQALLGMEPHRRRNRERLMRRRLWRRVAVYFGDLLCASLAAQLATLPAVIAWFGTQSIVSVPFNLLCVPLCMAGYVLAAASLALSALWLPLGMLIARVPDALFTALTAITGFGAALPVAAVRIGRYPGALILAHAGILLAASDLSRLPIARRRFLPLTLILVACLSSLLTWLAAWPFGVVFLDAGQADCAVLRTRGHTYVFDAGDEYSPAADYLSATCLHLDAVILSHPHADHVAGLEDILAAFTPDAVYVPAGWFDVGGVSPTVERIIAQAQAMGVSVCELAEGDSVRLSDAATLSVWSPDFGTLPADINDLSLVSLVTCGEHSVMFTGDLSMDGEPSIVPDCDILKVAHHGADNATSARFLRAASPEIAVIQVGENDFGHPGPEALSRLSASGAKLLRTDRLGAISLRPDGDSWRVTSFLEAPDDLE